MQFTRHCSRTSADGSSDRPMYVQVVPETMRFAAKSLAAVNKSAIVYNFPTKTVVFPESLDSLNKPLRSKYSLLRWCLEWMAI